MEENEYTNGGGGLSFLGQNAPKSERPHALFGMQSTVETPDITTTGSYNRRVTRARAENADMASVGYNEDKFAELMASGRGLSQISDDELDFIRDRYSKSDISKRKAYTNSAADQFLSSAGLPSSKELNTYRQKYIDYMGNGGMEQYSQLLEKRGDNYYFTDTAEWIKNQWAKDNAEGLLGETVTSGGKDIKYEDTLLDEQLKAEGFPPASQLNEYYLKYKADQKAKQDTVDYQKRVDNMFGEVMRLENNGMDREEAFNKVSENYKDFVDSSKQYQDVPDYGINLENYEKFYARKTNEKKWAKYAEQQNKIKEDADKAFVTPAVSEQDKQKQLAAITKYISSARPAYADGTPVKVSDFDGYLNVVNAGVPMDVINLAKTQGVSAFRDWNNEANYNDIRKWTALEALISNITKDDGDYSENLNVLRKTVEVSKKKDYDKNSKYDPSLYDAQVKPEMSTSRSNAVSVDGAIYNAVNGREYGQIVGATPAQMEMFRDLTSTDYSDQSLISYMTEDERGSFNALFKESPSRGLSFLSDLQAVLEKRQDGVMQGNVLFSPSMEAAEESSYRMNLADEEKRIESIREWQTNYWKKEAWDRYSSYSDEALQTIIDDANEKLNSAPTQPLTVQMYDEEEANKYYDLIKNAQFVLDTRKQAREDAQILASFYGYTDEDGAKATEYVKQNLDKYDPNGYARLANDVESIEERNAQRAKEAGENANFTAGSMQMTIDLGGLKTYREDELAHTFAQMDENQRNRYNWLLVNRGEEQANAYVNSIMRGMSSKAAEKQRAEYSAIADDGKMSNTRASIASVLNYPYTGLNALAGSILNKAVGIETNEEQATRWDVTGGIREGVQQNITDVFDSYGLDDGINFLYGVAMSSADSTLGAMFGGAGAAMLSTSAYASTLKNGLNRGLSQEEATKTALSAAVAEYITEKMGIDALTEGWGEITEAAAKQGAPIWKTILGRMGVNFVPEALEEGAGNIMQTVSDMLINGDKSEILEYYNDAIAKGMTVEEAKKLSANKFAKETALEMLAGGLAGAQSVGAGGIAIATRHGISSWISPETTKTDFGHFKQYFLGRGVVTDIFGQQFTDSLSEHMNQGETVLEKRNINGIIDSLPQLRDTDELYDFVYDGDGNIKLSNNEQVALASALNALGAEADLDSIEQAYVDFMANKQSARQRLSNTNNKYIKTSQELHDSRAKLNSLQNDVENAKRDYQGELDKANTALKDSETRLQAVNEKINAVESAIASRVGGDATKLSSQLNALLASQSALITEVNNHQNALNKVTGEKKRNLDTTVSNCNSQIRDIQRSLDRHYASYSNLLATSTTKRSAYEAQYRFASMRVAEIGNQIDSLISSDTAYFANSEKYLENMDNLQTQLAEAQQEMDFWDRKRNKTAPSKLSDAIAAAHSGTVKEFLDSTEPAKATAPATANTANTAETANTPSNTAEQANQPSDAVKQENTAQGETAENATEEKKEEPKKAVEKKTYTISKTTQEKFDRIAKKFGLEIVWQTRAEIGGNGRYSSKEPNKVYLATDMIADKGLLKETVVAREFFTHEVVHYVANTQWYQRLSSLAEAWYKYSGDKEYGGGSGDDYFEFLIQEQINQEKELHHRDFTREQAREELTAYFVQDVLFTDKNGTESLDWLTKMDGNAVQNFLATVEYLIKRGQVRRMKDGSAIKTLLLDAEHALGQAIRERKVLDAAGLSSSFSTEKKNTEQKNTAQTQKTEQNQQNVEQNAEENAEPAQHAEQAQPVAEESKTEQPAPNTNQFPNYWVAENDWNTAKKDIGSFDAYDTVMFVANNMGMEVGTELVNASDMSNEDNGVFDKVDDIASMLSESEVSPAAVATFLNTIYKDGGIDAIKNIPTGDGEANDAIVSAVKQIDSEHGSGMYSVGTTIDELSSDFNPNVSGRAATLSGDNASFTSADEAIEKSGVLVNENGDPVMNVINDGNGAMFSLGTYEAFGKDALEKYLNDRVKKQLLDKDYADNIKNQMERIYKFSKEFADKNVAFGNWSYAEVRKDPNGNPSLSVITPNAEYDMNMDFSLVCVKRRALNEVINEIVRRGLMESLIFDEEAIARVNEKIRSMNYETACKMCFVESARYEQAKYADKFVERYNKLVNSLGGEADYFNFGGNETLETRAGIQFMDNGSLDFTEIDKVLGEYMKRKGIDTLPAYNAEKGLAGANTDEAIAFELKNNPESRRLLLRGDFMSTNGFDSLAMRSPSVLKLWNKKGQGAPKNQFSDMQYLNDIEKKSWNPEAAYNVGGVRVQSFSDYVPTMFFDYVQMVADLAAGKMPAHAYTKEQNFVKLFGLTGIKINMSLVPMVANDGLAAGLKYQRDENGNIVKDANGKPVITYAWAEESFGYDRKKKELNYDLINSIQADEKYGKNCGTIAIGVSDEHILRMMADPTIKMIIPYHSSNIPSVVADMVNIKAFEDYQDIQHTRKWNGKKWVNLSPKEEFQFNEVLHKNGDPKATVKEYLDWCEKNGYAPKFEADNKSTKFKNNEGYYKVLEDFTLYDNNGNYVPQGAVQMQYAEDGDLFGNVESILEKSLKDPRMSMISDNVDELTDNVLSVLQKNDDNAMYSGGTTIEDLSKGFDNNANNEYNDDEQYVQLTDQEIKEFDGNLFSFLEERIGSEAKWFYPICTDARKKQLKRSYWIAGHMLYIYGANDFKLDYYRGKKYDEYTRKYKRSNGYTSRFGSRASSGIGIRRDDGRQGDSRYLSGGSPQEEPSVQRGISNEYYSPSEEKHVTGSTEQGASSDSDDRFSAGTTISDLSQGYTPRESIDDIRKIFNQRDSRSSGVDDAKYMELAEKYDSDIGNRNTEWQLDDMVRKAAKSAGYDTPKLYHGTRSFGFTKFSTDGSLPYARKGFIYTSTKSNVAANYAGDNHYAFARSIGRPYDGGSSAESIIKDAKTVLGATYAIPTEEYIANRIRSDYEKAREIADKFNDMGSPSDNIPQEVSNAWNNLIDVVYTIVDGDLAYGNGADGIINGSEEEKAELKKYLDYYLVKEYYGDSSRYEKYARIIKDYLAEHGKELSAEDNAILRYAVSYDVGDAYIDFMYGISQALQPDGKLINAKGSFQDMSDLRESLDSSHNIAAYQLYGDLGDKPFIFDANGAQFWALKVPEVSDDYVDTDTVSKWAKENGYTSVVMKNIYDYGEKADNYVFFNSEQVKSADPVTYDDSGEIIPLSERFSNDADIRYSNGTTMQDLIASYGKKKQSGLGMLNDVQTAERTSKSTRISDVAQTVKEAPAQATQEWKDHVDDIVVEVLDENAVPVVTVGKNAGLVYRPMTMEEMNELGDEYITRSGGVDQAMRDLARDIPNATVSDLTKLEAAAMRVIAEVSKTNNFNREDSAEFLAALGILNSNWGRMGKAMQLLNNSPLGRRKYMEKVVERLNTENKKKFGKGAERLFHRNGVKEIVIPESKYRDLELATTPEEVRKAEFRISEEIGKQSPLSISDAIRNWRYFAMLANPVTHGRNLLGNTGMLGMRMAKDAIAAGLENVAVKTGFMDAEDRTHYVNRAIPKEVSDFAVQLFADNAEQVQGQDRYGVRDKIHDAIKKSPVKLFDTLMRFNGDMLEKEDKIFLRLTYVSAAKQYMMSRGLTNVNDLTAKQKAEIHQYAKQQAQEATYRDASALADTLNALAKKGGAWQFAIESTIPFKKTPINITKRGIEYSPVGLAKGVIDLAKYAVNKGKSADGQYRIPASKIADELGKGLVGSALALIGAFLAKAGILKLKAGDGDRDEAYEKDLGHQDYSLEIGNMSIKIESLVPMTFPLFVGAAAMDALSSEEKKAFIPAMSEAMLSIADPIMDMSFMSSLNNTLNSYSKNKLLGIAQNAVSSYASQFAPTVIGRLNSSLYPTRRTTKSSQKAKEGIGTENDYTLRSIASKTPGLNLALEPYVKTTGEYDVKDSFGDYLLAHINAFLSPVNVQMIDTNPVKNEIARLVESTGNVDFVPQNPQKYFKDGDTTYNLTAKEYTEYSKDHNETVYAMLKDVINSEDYQNAETDDDRADLLKKAYNKSHEVARKKWKAIIIERHSNN